MRPFEAIQSCLDVTDDDIRSALAPARSFDDPGPRPRTLALVGHMAKIAKPARGAPKMLIVLAHLATRDWLDGDLEVKLIGDDEVSVIELFVDPGFGKERILGPLRIDVPLREFVTGIRAHPELIQPLSVVGKVEDRRVLLRTTPLLRKTTIPPAYSAVSPSLLPMVGTSGRSLPELMSSAPPSRGAPPTEPSATEERKKK